MPCISKIKNFLEGKNGNIWYSTFKNVNVNNASLENVEYLTGDKGAKILRL